MGKTISAQAAHFVPATAPEGVQGQLCAKHNTFTQQEAAGVTEYPDPGGDTIGAEEAAVQKSSSPQLPLLP